MPIPTTPTAQIAESSGSQSQSESDVQQRSAAHAYWLQMTMSATLQYTLEREAEWARG